MQVFNQGRCRGFLPGAEVTRAPVGFPCLRCSEPIAANDPGIVMPLIGADGLMSECAEHMECHLRSLVGSVKHQRGECGCATGDYASDDDSEFLTPRQAARAATRTFLQSQGLRGAIWWEEQGCE